MPTPVSKQVLPFLFGFVCALICLFAGAYLYLQYGQPPVAVADQPFPDERAIAHSALNARIHRDQTKAPFSADPAVLEAGAHVYMDNCAMCHGTPGHTVSYAAHMFPSAPQLWAKHHNGVVGVSDDEAGETFWKVRNGIRLAGMPAYNKLLSTEEMWQVSLLLKNADQPLPAPVTTLLAAAPTVPLVAAH